MSERYADAKVGLPLWSFFRLKHFKVLHRPETLQSNQSGDSGQGRRDVAFKQETRGVRN